MPSTARSRRVLASTLVTGALVATSSSLAPDVASAATAADDPGLYLVTLEGAPSVAAQDATLATVGATEPVYRWQTALNGYAVRLTDQQASTLATDPRVVSVERDSIRQVAAVSRVAAATAATAAAGPRTGGAGVVIGFVDTGLWPDSPVFADVRGLGRQARGFRGTCETGPGWSPEVCDRKVVGARWYVEGFGADRIRTSSSLSPLDDDGHGTLVASVAAGNAGVTVQLPGRSSGRRADTYSGAAPQARVAVYKACWTAPDPHDDGCSTADLVTAVDQAVADGVDVLNLSVEGPSEPMPGVDTLDRALLGAAESDVVVVAASGNRGGEGYAAHAAPWVTSVGGTTGEVLRGAVVAKGLRLVGGMASRIPTRAVRVVLGARVPALGSSAADSRFCLPDSLDAASVAGRIVVCERGRVGRVDKSGAVGRADGVGMVLVNTSRGQVAADFHSVPTVHLTKSDGRRLSRWLRDRPDARVALRPAGVQRAPQRLVSWTSSGDPQAGFLAPDLVTTAVGVLGAAPPDAFGRAWDLGSGTSMAAARVSGLAAALLARHDWSAAMVRSALVTSAGNLPGDPSLLRLGSGRVRGRAADRPGLVFPVAPGDYRAWLDGRRAARDLNTPSALLHGTGTITRTVTNVGTRPMYYSSSTRGFRRYDVSVTPAAFYLDPGESATFTVTVSGGAGPQPLDDGWVAWRGANGNRVRMPVVIAR